MHGAVCWAVSTGASFICNRKSNLGISALEDFQLSRFVLFCEINLTASKPEPQKPTRASQLL